MNVCLSVAPHLREYNSVVRHLFFCQVNYKFILKPSVRVRSASMVLFFFI